MPESGSTDFEMTNSLELCHAICRCICRDDRDLVLKKVEDDPTVPTQQDLASHSRSPSRAPAPKIENQLSFVQKRLQIERSDADIQQSVKAFQQYSKGGHIEADQKVFNNTPQAPESAPTGVATDPEALERLRIADEEMAAALFDDNYEGALKKASPQKNRDPELIRTSADGKRHEWQTTFVYGGGKEPEASLLD